MIKNNYDIELRNIIRKYFSNITEEELKDNQGFFREIIDGLPVNNINDREDNFPLFELTFTDKDNLIYKVYYYSHLYGKDNVFKKVSLTEEKYFSILDDENGYCTYNKERSYYCGEYIWEKDNNPEIERVVNIFTYLYGLKIFKGIKKIVRSRG